jgi:hypothetical protein
LDVNNAAISSGYSPGGAVILAARPRALQANGVIIEIAATKVERRGRQDSEKEMKK